MKSISHNLLSTYEHSDKVYRVREEIMVPIHKALNLVRKTNLALQNIENQSKHDY